MHDRKRIKADTDIACKAVHLCADRRRNRFAGEYGQVVSAETPCLSAEHLFAMRQTRDADAAPQGEKVLFGQVPSALVERSSGTYHTQSRANENVPVLRRGIRRASERKPEILQPKMLHSRPNTGGIN